MYCWFVGLLELKTRLLFETPVKKNIFKKITQNQPKFAPWPKTIKNSIPAKGLGFWTKNVLKSPPKIQSFLSKKFAEKIPPYRA